MQERQGDEAIAIHRWRGAMEGGIDFNLSAVQPAERFPLWHDVGSLVYRPVDVDGDIAAGLHVQSRMIQLDGLVMGQMIASKQRYERTHSMIRRDHIDHVLIVLLEQGSLAWESDGTRLVAGAGDIVLLDTSTSCQSGWSEHGQLFVNIPRDLLGPRGSSWQPSSGVLPAHHACAPVLSQHLRAIWALQLWRSDQVARNLGLDLFTLLQKYLRKDPSVANRHDLEIEDEFLVASIQHWMESRLNQPALDAATVGNFFHLPPSKVTALFHRWGGVNAYVQMRRRKRVMEALQTCREPGIHIDALARNLDSSGLTELNQTIRERCRHKADGFDVQQSELERLKRASEIYYAMLRSGR